jgi:hypothetical protein
VTRGTRPEKPSSCRGFARKARGAWGTRGSWGLKTENRKPKYFFPSFPASNNNPNLFIYLFIYIFFRPDGGRMGCLTDQTGCPTGPNGVPNGSHVIGHVIFECHVTRLGWQGVILLPTLLSQR